MELELYHSYSFCQIMALHIPNKSCIGNNPFNETLIPVLKLIR